MLLKSTVLALSIAGVALAQGTPSAQPDRPGESARRTAEEEIIVTGTRIPRKDLTTPAPITLINHEQIYASGKASIGEFLQALPEQGNALNSSAGGFRSSTRVTLDKTSTPSGSWRESTVRSPKRPAHSRAGIGT